MDPDGRNADGSKRDWVDKVIAASLIFWSAMLMVWLIGNVYLHLSK